MEIITGMEAKFTGQGSMTLEFLIRPRHGCQK